MIATVIGTGADADPGTFTSAGMSMEKVDHPD
jgi:hypothetical protein